jgi:hypothetical protein
MSSDLMILAGHIHPDKFGVRKKKMSYIAYIKNTQIWQNRRALMVEQVII